MNTKRWMMLLLALLLLVGCGERGNDPEMETEEAPEPTVVATSTPMRTGVTLLADGHVRTVDPAQPLTFEASGKLLTVNVGAGDQVAFGDLIASLDDTHARDEVARAQLNLVLTELALADLKKEPEPADVASLRASLASAKANLTMRTTPPSEAQLNAARANLVSAEHALQARLDAYAPDGIDIAIVKQQVEQAKNALWSAQLQRDATCGWVGKGGSETQCDAANASVNQAEASVRIAELGLDQKLKGVPEGELASARAGIAQAESALADLLKAPDADAMAAAEAQVEQAQAALDKLLAGATAQDLARAETQVAQSQLALDIAERGLEKCKLIAQASGQVLSVDAASGALVGSGSPIVTLLDTRRFEFHTTNLSERDVVLIQRGQKADVTLKAYPDDPIEAIVARVGLVTGEPVGDAATFPVVLTLNENTLEIRPGMTGRVELRVQK